jgi:phospholipase C
MSIEKIRNWVVVMFENRSFDSLLGYLPHIDSADGLRDKNITLPYPGGTVKVGPTGNFTDPIPDPGEGYPNVNAQVYGRYLPESNAGKAPYLAFPNRMQSPFNAPQPGEAATMDGFALDFFHNGGWERGKPLTHQEMQSIGGMFTPQTAPVLNTLAEQYAVFTQWHADVPSCTFPNRTFFHAGTSAGRVDNHIVWDYAWNNDLPNLFQRMTEHDVDWRCYFDESQVVPFEAINLGGAHHRGMWKSHSTHMPDFYNDAANGTLPRYSWVEPCMMFGDLADYHPPTDIRAAEAFLARVYNAVRTSPQWEETALVVMFDEHGGCFDHVVPPAAVAPDDSPCEEGFGFDRLGIRIPTLVISAHTQRGTVIRDLHANTSMTRTLMEQLDLGEAFGKRDGTASTIEAAFNRTKPRKDMHQLTVQPYIPGQPNPHAQQTVVGDEPTMGVDMAQRKALGKQYVSRLGEATLESAAVLLGMDPAAAPTDAHADAAKAWMNKHFIKDGHLNLPKGS